jgi:8-oxo-dGTP pyrophosphatase MutT (NUDIX family)
MEGSGDARRIPRPSAFEPGDPPPWSGLPDELRHVGIADVRAACAALPAPRRIAEEPDAEGPDTMRPAAVLIPIFEEDGAARVIVTIRPDTMPSHRGDAAFPGGKFEPGVDTDLQATALREAYEEIGIEPATVEVVAELDHLLTVRSSFALAPFVGLLPGRPRLVPHAREVRAVFDVALGELLREDVFREERWTVPPELEVSFGTHRSVHFFEIAGETVWGATAHILSGFLTHLTTFVRDVQPQRGPPGAPGVS